MLGLPGSSGGGGGVLCRFPLEALLPGPGFDQGPIDGEVLVRQQFTLAAWSNT